MFYPKKRRQVNGDQVYFDPSQLSPSLFSWAYKPYMALFYFETGRIKTNGINDVDQKYKVI